jgi:Protein of unknown function (DUF3224)
MSLRNLKRRSWLAVAIGVASLAQFATVLPADAPPGDTMTQHANGAFEVKITPQAEDKSEGVALGRMSLQKTFSGDLQGTSHGEMLTAMGNVEGSAVYVAIERIKGTLQGRSGTFALSHRGTMTRGAQQLTIDIVPDSGTDELAGIAGSMTIKIEAGKHFYALTYSLPR